MSDETNDDQPATTEEIERKYLLDSPPDVPAEAERRLIEQGYLAGDDAPSSDPAHVEGRVRRITMDDGSIRYTHTIKRGEGLVREESNRDLSKEEFERLWDRTESRRLTKTRRRLRIGDVLWEIDHVHELDVDLAEAELPHRDTPVEIPSWLERHIVREVTGEPEFTNFELARKAIAARSLDDR